jgi:hypothetical protein
MRQNVHTVVSEQIEMYRGYHSFGGEFETNALLYNFKYVFALNGNLLSVNK